jgi:hypothetical protein
MSRTHDKGNKSSVFPENFFGALSIGDDDSAFACLQAEAFPDTEPPSPRAQALIESGEWDSNQKLSLVFIERQSCNGKVGNDDTRFCGKPPNYCQVATHIKNTVGEIKRGWYISIGKTQGVLTSPFLPSSDEGGPIRGSAPGRLVTGENPFRMTKGQWKFVIDSWRASQVEVLSESDEDLSPPASHPTIDTSVTGLQEPGESIADTLAFTTASPTDNVASLLAEDPNFLIVREMVRTLEARLVAMDQNVAALTSRNRTLEEALESHRTHSVESHRANSAVFRGIQERMTAVEHQAANAGDMIGDGHSFRDRMDALDEAVFSSNGLVSQFRNNFTDFKEKFESGGGIECHGISFKSQRDCVSWFGRDAGALKIEVFLDGLAYLHAIREAVVHTDDATRQRESQIKTMMSTGLEVAVITSFDTILPSVLVGGKRITDTAMGGTYAWLQSYLKTFKVWKPIGTTNGVSHQILAGVGRVTQRAYELRKRMAMPDALMLSAGLCQDSAHFCNELVRFINEQQEELTANTAYTDEQVWAMQLECLQRIVEELSEARESVADAARFEPGYYLWGMLRAWKIQQRYIENHFKDDPALTGVLVRRILMQGQDTNVKKQLDKVDSVDHKLEAYKRDNNNAVKQLKDDVAKLKK